MSYNPIPPRVWSRVQNQCTYTDASGNSDINYNQIYIPLTKQTVTQARANYEDKMIYKGNVLQYKGNSSRLTKSQKYTQLAKGCGPNRTKVFATQSQTYTNPNTTGLRRKNTQTYPYPNPIVGAPNNPSGPFQYNVMNPNDCDGVSLQDGGTLVCGTFANPCTGEIIKQGATSSIIYNPASASDVPGSSVLFWDTQVQTWFPKPRYVMNNSTDKWPVNYKGLDGISGLVSAIRPDAPVLTIDSITCNSVTLSWDVSNNSCLPITTYNIYQNGIIVQTVPYTTTSTTINGLVPGITYSFFITSISNTIESLPSNNGIVTQPPCPPIPLIDITAINYNATLSNFTQYGNKGVILFTDPSGSFTINSLTGSITIFAIGPGGNGGNGATAPVGEFFYSGGGGGGGGGGYFNSSPSAISTGNTGLFNVSVGTPGVNSYISKSGTNIISANSGNSGNTGTNATITGNGSGGSGGVGNGNGGKGQNGNAPGQDGTGGGSLLNSYSFTVNSITYGISFGGGGGGGATISNSVNFNGGAYCGGEGGSGGTGTRSGSNGSYNINSIGSIQVGGGAGGGSSENGGIIAYSGGTGSNGLVGIYWSF